MAAQLLLNLTAECLDPYRLIYRVPGRSVEEIQAVYDRGVKLDWHGEFRSLHDLIGLDPQLSPKDGSFTLGEVATAKAVGCFRLAGVPVGPVTVDARVVA